MAVDDERRLLAIRRLVVLVARRVVDRVRGLAAFGRELDRPGDAEVAAVDVRGVGRPHDLFRLGVEIEDEHAFSEQTRAREHRDLVARDLNPGKRRV